MPGEILAGLASSILPGLGAQAAAQMQRRWALDDLEAQNIYNSPREQLRRLKEAGLPAASFFSGGVSSQSDQPRTTNVDPTLGVAEGVQNYFQNRIQSMQLKALDADVRLKRSAAQLAEADTERQLTAWKQEDGSMLRKFDTLKDAADRKALAESDIAVINRDIRRIDASYHSDQQHADLYKTRADIQRTLAQFDLARQQFKTTEEFNKWQLKAIEEWERGGVSALELFIYQLLYGRSRPTVGAN